MGLIEKKRNCTHSCKEGNFTTGSLLIKIRLILYVHCVIGMEKALSRASEIKKLNEIKHLLA